MYVLSSEGYTLATALMLPRSRGTVRLANGISGLRVADASMMPSAPSANTNTTVYAVAERAAALIQAR